MGGMTTAERKAQPARVERLARRAGVGNATLYRHFSDRHELIHVVASYSLARITEQAEAALEEETDAFEALRRFVHRAADERVGALCSLLFEGFDTNDPHVVDARLRLEAAVTRLMDNARESGELRPDVGLGDLMVAITQLTRPVAGTACSQVERFMHRHLQLFLDGLRAPARSELSGTAVTFEDFGSK